jgi:hypothetical protein
LIGWAVALAIAACPARASADFTYRIVSEAATLSPGSSAEFTVYLDVTTPTALKLTDFQVTLILTGDKSGVGFVGATTDPTDSHAIDPAHTDAKYIFEGNSFGAAVSTGVNFFFPEFATTEPYVSSLDPLPYPPQPNPLSLAPPTTIILNDLINLNVDPPVPVTVEAGTTVRLGTVTVGNFNAPSTGSVQVMFSRNPLDIPRLGAEDGVTNFVDPTIPNSVSYEESQGLLTVTANGDVTAVPAPPGVVLFAAGWGCLALTRLARRRPAAARAESV